MDNPFAGLKQVSTVETADQPAAWKRLRLDPDRWQKRDALYAEFTPIVYKVLDQLIEAYRPGIWKKGSDCGHKFCCHCRWYAGPEETGRAGYDDHPVRRRLEIELETGDGCSPTGFKVLVPGTSRKCVRADLNREALVRGLLAVLE